LGNNLNGQGALNKGKIRGNESPKNTAVREERSKEEWRVASAENGSHCFNPDLSTLTEPPAVSDPGPAERTWGRS
jgi:hypothetical protein